MKQNKLLCSQKCRTLFYGLQKFDGTIYHFFFFFKEWILFILTKISHLYFKSRWCGQSFKILL